MAKPKDKWQSESVSLSQNPFAALSGLNKPAEASITTQSNAGNPQKNAGNSQKKEEVLKVKSCRLERAHHGGKTVTVVNFHGEPSDEAKTAWIKTMKKELGVGGVIEDGVVMLQGDLRERLGK